MKTTSHASAGQNLAARVRVTLLGPLRAEVDGRAVDLGRPQNELLLARLALSAPGAVSADALIDALWDEEPPASARKNLQKCVSELRRYLGPDAITTERTGYALSVPPENIDRIVVERILEDARAAKARNRPAEAWEQYKRAAEMWAERALDGVPETRFVVDEVDRLGVARVSMLEEQLDVGLDLGKHVELIPTLEALVHRHPLRERLWGALMVALYRAGRQADALATYRRLRKVLGEELGIEPSPEMRKLEEKILLHAPSLAEPPKQTPIHNAPRGYTSFVGRDRELESLHDLLESSRLITMTGAGGSGKTRLALETATTTTGSFPDGVWFADLASIAEESEVIPTVASGFGLSDEPGSSGLDTLIGFLQGARLLLILDNCEHLTSGTAALVDAILGATSSVTVLATSREPLGLMGERLFPLEPMPVPPEDGVDPEIVGAVDSVRLFVERATGADPGFVLSDEVAPIVADICRRLDGIPLAIELAARQLHVLGAEELRRGLLDHLSLGAPGERDARHRTMEAAIGWSFNQMDEEHRRIFLALSAFPGSFNLDAARYVAGVTDEIEMASMLSGLVGCSMLVRLGDATGARYRLLEPIRDFATRAATRAGVSDRSRRAHCEWVLALFNDCSPIRGPHEREYLGRLSAEHHHLIAALDWATTHDAELALRVLIAGIPYTQMIVYRFRWSETASLVIAENSDLDKRLRAEALARGAEALAENFEHDKVVVWSSAALELAEELGEPMIAGLALIGQGWSHRGTGALTDAEKDLRAAVERFEEAGDLIGVGQALHSLSFVLMAQGRYQATQETSLRALDLWLKMGSDWGAGRAWWHLAAAHTREGAYEEARNAVTRALRYFEGFEDIGSMNHVRAVQGDIARLSGHPEWARTVYLECLQGFQDIGDRRCAASTFRNLGLVAIQLDRDDEAVGLLQASLRRRNDLQDLAGVTECLEGLGLIGYRTERDELAVMMYASAERLRGETRASPPPTEQEEIGAVVEGLRTRMGDDRFWKMWGDAKELSMERVLEEAHSMSLAGR